MANLFQDVCIATYFGARRAWFARERDLLVSVGMLLLISGLFTGTALAQGNNVVNTLTLRCGIYTLLSLVEGNLGSLLMVVAGIGTLVSAAMGMYRTAYSVLVVIIGCFTLRSFMYIFFNVRMQGLNDTVCYALGTPVGS